VCLERIVDKIEVKNINNITFIFFKMNNSAQTPADAHVPIQITFKEEVSDHDGYCSGGECELTTRIYKKVIHVDVSEIANRLEYFTKYADEVICNDDGSYYCDLRDDAKTAGLQKHDHRVTVLNVEVIDIK
jgi:hypothetical protein